MFIQILNVCHSAASACSKFIIIYKKNNFFKAYANNDKFILNIKYLIHSQVIRIMW